MKRRILTLAAYLLGTFLHVTGAAAENVILTLQHVASGQSVTFTDEQLMALPQERFETETIWTEGVVEFSGPSLKTVIEAAEMAPGDVQLYAINDYNIVLPLDKIEDGAPVLANRIDGAPFSVRDKGPLWVVFPYDDVSRYNNEEYFALSVWQLNRLNVLSE
ncbi:MAG: oxidoreductase [Pelagibaca sp.]